MLSKVPVLASTTYTLEWRLPSMRPPSSVTEGLAATSCGADAGNLCRAKLLDRKNRCSEQTRQMVISASGNVDFVPVVQAQQHVVLLLLATVGSHCAHA